jgi:hypothetical protein
MASRCNPSCTATLNPCSPCSRTKGLPSAQAPLLPCTHATLLQCSRKQWAQGAFARNGKRYVVRGDEMLTAFKELETAIHEFAVSLIL